MAIAKFSKNKNNFSSKLNLPVFLDCQLIFDNLKFVTIHLSPIKL